MLINGFSMDGYDGWSGHGGPRGLFCAAWLHDYDSKQKVKAKKAWIKREVRRKKQE